MRVLGVAGLGVQGFGFLDSGVQGLGVRVQGVALTLFRGLRFRSGV